MFRPLFYEMRLINIADSKLVWNWDLVNWSADTERVNNTRSHALFKKVYQSPDPERVNNTRSHPLFILNVIPWQIEEQVLRVFPEIL